MDKWRGEFCLFIMIGYYVLNVLYRKDELVLKIVNSMVELIGSILIVKFNCFQLENAVQVYLKLEFFNLSGSVKDRVVYNMIIEVEKSGYLKFGFVIIELISGNIGIGLVMNVVVCGYRVIFVMFDMMMKECINLLKVYGVEVVLILGVERMFGSIKKVKEFVEQIFGSFILM